MPKGTDKLTDAQLDTLAESLVDTRKNVFTVAKAMFGTDVGDDVFDALREKEELFRCELCGRWTGLCLESEIHEVCCDCEREEDEDESEDEGDE